MKFKTKILIIISILIVISITRECGILNFNFYYSNLTKHFEQDLNKKELSFETDKSDFHTIFKNESFTEKAINIVEIHNKKAPGENNAFDITIKKISIPISIIPLYTNIDYEVVATINDRVTITKTGTINLYIIEKNINGSITTKGNLKAFGLLSNYEIKRLIISDYKENLKKEFKKFII